MLEKIFSEITLNFATEKRVNLQKEIQHTSYHETIVLENHPKISHHLTITRVVNCDKKWDISSIF